jgi:hypothetical protein
VAQVRAVSDIGVERPQASLNRFTNRWLENVAPLIVDGEKRFPTNRRIMTEHSEQLCFEICGRPTCPGRCAGARLEPLEEVEAAWGRRRVGLRPVRGADGALSVPASNLQRARPSRSQPFLVHREVIRQLSRRSATAFTSPPT